MREGGIEESEGGRKGGWEGWSEGGRKGGRGGVVSEGERNKTLAQQLTLCTPAASERSSTSSSLPLNLPKTTQMRVTDDSHPHTVT